MGLEQVAGLEIYPRSQVEIDGVIYFLSRGSDGKRLGILGDASSFAGEQNGEVTLCSLTAANAAALRARLP